MIAENLCKDGYLYFILARNSYFGVYSAALKTFIIRRVKFGDVFLFPENHWDANSFPTAAPMEELEKAPDLQWSTMDDPEGLKLAYLTEVMERFDPQAIRQKYPQRGSLE